MRLKIWKNRHKYITGHWKKDPAWQWLARTQDEVKELKHAMKVEAESYYPISLADAKQKRKLEAIDVANFAMMVAYADEVD